MVNRLSFIDLLGLLRIREWYDNKPLNRQDQIIKDWCGDVTSYIQQGNLQSAVDQAQKAVEQAKQIRQNLHAPNLHGMALLHLSLVYQTPGVDLAMSECSRAVTVFGHSEHNRTIARIFQGKIDQELKNWSRALIHFQAAADALERLLETRFAKKDEELTANYKKLQDYVVEELAKLSGRGTVSVPGELVWPDSDFVGIEFLPVYGQFSTDGRVVRNSRQTENGTDYVEVSRFSIEGQLFSVSPLNSSLNGKRLLRIQHHQQYMSVQVRKNGDGNHHVNNYVLMRLQDKIDQASQILVVANHKKKRMWIIFGEEIEIRPEPTIIGGTGPQPQLVRFRIPGENPPSQEGRVIGVVEAVLAPIE